MSNKSYQQYCSVASALDVIGQRWTLLIIRELLTGPKRFKALNNQLPGIGSNLLTSRLRDLEQNGLIVQEAVAPGNNHTVYTLTTSGEALRPAVQALLTWGKPLLPADTENVTLSRSWLHLTLQQALDTNPLHQLSACYTFIVDEQIIQVCITAGRVNVHPDASCNPDLIITCKSDVLVAILLGSTTLKHSLKAGLLQYEGNLEDLIRVFEQLHAAQE